MTSSELYQLLRRAMDEGKTPNASMMIRVDKDTTVPLSDLIDEKQLEMLTGFNTGTESIQALDRQFGMNADLVDVNQNNSGDWMTKALGGQQRLPANHDPLQYDYYKAGGGMGRHMMDDKHRFTGRWKKKPDPRLMAMHPNSPWMWDDYGDTRMDMLMGLLRPGRR